VGRLDPVECGLLHATRGRCGRFSVSAEHALTKKQRVGARFSTGSLGIRVRYAELATSRLPVRLLCAEWATMPVQSLWARSTGVADSCGYTLSWPHLLRGRGPRPVDNQGDQARLLELSRA
jgi:hypothetical protein